MEQIEEREQGSFRDPSGYVFWQDGQPYRRITRHGLRDWEKFVSTGLARTLLDQGQLVPYELLSGENLNPLLKLEKLPFLSYPYEWSFGQLRDAAALTLSLARQALRHGMILKDATAFNIAFRDGRPIFMDHTSFMSYHENEPWCAYRQFVMHFLAPLALMSKVDLRCLGLFQRDIGGIPLDLASRLLPWWTRFSPMLLFHIHLHAAMEKRYSSEQGDKRQVRLSKERLDNLLASLADYVDGLSIPGQNTQWEDYYANTSYSDATFQAKKEAVEEFCQRVSPGTLVDLGANTGVFSELAAKHSRLVIAADIDPQAVEQLYRLNRERVRNLQPILQDLSNPTPALGVFNEERMSFLQRCKGDAVLGLALIHHLRITCNWSLEQIARLFADIAPRALVEFVPADDVQAKRLMRGREEIYGDWTCENMLAAFQTRFTVERVTSLPGCGRTLMELCKKI
ncbi:MAG: class I SAM-dependent methyltransferase [Victivallales bacterium]|nr:class I SAM-dependent methyltransferase [Victivallales bacterium]